MIKAFTCSFIFCTLFTCFSAESFGQNTSQKLRSIVNQDFEILGLDQRSVSFTHELSAFIAETCRPYLSGDTDVYGPKIVVSLKPEPFVDFEGPFRIKVGADARVALDFRWDTSLGLELACSALTQAYLTRYVALNSGKTVVTEMKSWPVSALSSLSYLRLRPAQIGDFVDGFYSSGIVTISDLLDMPMRYGSLFRESYCLFLFLREGEPTRKELTTLIYKALTGTNISPEILSLVGNTLQDGLTLDDWWSRECLELIKTKQNFGERVDSSLEWITELANIDFGELAGVEELNLRNLWEHRSDSRVRSVIEARSELIKLRIQRVNPACFNSARSLGALYETLLNGNHVHEYLRSLTDYLREIEDTKRLSEQVETLLSY